MADTYDLAMQLFRVASEKQKIEKSQGKLKPEDEIQFTEASFNDFSQSLSREFSNLSPEEQKEAKRLLEYKINDNVSEVISGNASQGFSLNIQSVRTIVKNAVDIVQTSQAQASQSIANDAQQRKSLYTPENILDSFRKNNDIVALGESLSNLSIRDKFQVLKEIDINTKASLLEQELKKAGYDPYQDNGYSYGEDDTFKESYSKEALATQASKEPINESKKSVYPLEMSKEGTQDLIRDSLSLFNAREDPRFETIADLLIASDIPSYVKAEIYYNQEAFEQYYNQVIIFAHKTILPDVPIGKIDPKLLLDHKEELFSAYLADCDKDRSLDTKVTNKIGRSSEYTSLAQKLIDYSGFTKEQKLAFKNDQTYLLAYADTCMCLFKDHQENHTLSDETAQLYFQNMINKIPKDKKRGFLTILFPDDPEILEGNFSTKNLEKLGLNTLGKIIGKSIENGTFKDTLEKFSIKPDEINKIYLKNNQRAAANFIKKSNIRRANINNLLHNIPDIFDKLSNDQISKITELMVRSYSNKKYTNSQKVKNIKIKDTGIENSMYELYIEKNLPSITNDPSIINAVMNVVYKSNYVQEAIKKENNPLTSAALYLDEVKEMISYKGANPKALTQAIMLSYHRSFPNEPEFDQEVFINSLKESGVAFDEGKINDSNIISQVFDVIKKENTKYMDEVIYSTPILSRKDLDKYNFEKENQSTLNKPKGVFSEQSRTAKLTRFFRNEYGVRLAVPTSSPPSKSISSFMNFKDDNERRDFQDLLRHNELFALEYTNMVKKMQSFVTLKGETNFTEELLDDFKRTYFSDTNHKLAENITMTNMQRVFDLVNNKDLDKLLSISDFEQENMQKYLSSLSHDQNVEYGHVQTNKSNTFRQKYDIYTNTDKSNQSVDDYLDDFQPIESTDTIQSVEESFDTNQSSFKTVESANDQNAQPPAVQKGGLIGFINRFRNNMKNSNKDKGLINNIKDAFINAKNGTFATDYENKSDDQELPKDNQILETASHSEPQLDEMSQRLRAGLNVDNIGVKDTKANNEVKNSDQREAESEEEQL